MLNLARRIYRKLIYPKPISEAKLISQYIKAGGVPWSKGYEQAKWNLISRALHSTEIMNSFKVGQLNSGYGIGIDERSIEYPWIFSNLGNTENLLLDAGSTFNFQSILDLEALKRKKISIYTFYPESRSFNERNISYHYGDLRLLPFRDEWFAEIVCQSTIEHIDMDNSIYGYELKGISEPLKKSYEYLLVISELVRVLKSKGLLLMTFPYGKFENHGFFQQFDAQMLEPIVKELRIKGELTLTFFRYFKDGWRFVSKEDCETSESYNPQTGVGKGDDGAAHCRGICCLKFVKA